MWLVWSVLAPLVVLVVVDVAGGRRHRGCCLPAQLRDSAVADVLVAVVDVKVSIDVLTPAEDLTSLCRHRMGKSCDSNGSEELR